MTTLLLVLFPSLCGCVMWHANKARTLTLQKAMTEKNSLFQNKKVEINHSAIL